MALIVLMYVWMNSPLLCFMRSMSKELAFLDTSYTWMGFSFANRLVKNEGQYGARPCIYCVHVSVRYRTRYPQEKVLCWRDVSMYSMFIPYMLAYSARVCLTCGGYSAGKCSGSITWSVPLSNTASLKCMSPRMAIAICSFVGPNR